MGKPTLREQLAEVRDKRPARTTEDFVGVLSGLIGGAARFEVCETKWPKTEVKIGLRLLSDWEVREADKRARAWAEDAHIGTGRDRLEEREFVARYAVELIALSLCDPQKKTPLVGNAEELAKIATREEIEALSTQLSDHQETFAPLSEQLSDEEVERLAEAVKKAPGTAATVLRTCAPSTLRRCIISLVAPRRKPTGSSSTPLTQPGSAVPAN